MKEVIRYIISGGIAAVVDLGALYIFVHWFHLQYLVSVVIAFIIAFVFSFLLQKFMTFREYSKKRIPKEATLYFAVSLINLLFNTSLMYVGVSVLHIQYLVSQFLVNGLIAIGSFFVYKYLIFPVKINEEAQN